MCQYCEHFPHRGQDIPGFVLDFGMHVVYLTEISLELAVMRWMIAVSCHCIGAYIDIDVNP